MNNPNQIDNRQYQRPQQQDYLSQRPPIPVQHSSSQLSQEQQERMRRAKQHNHRNFEQQMARSMAGNNQIMAHRMSNMNSLTSSELAQQYQGPMGDHVSFGSLPSDDLQTTHQRQQSYPSQQQAYPNQQQGYPNQRQSYPSQQRAYPEQPIGQRQMLSTGNQQQLQQQPSRQQAMLQQQQALQQQQLFEQQQAQMRQYPSRSLYNPENDRKIRKDMKRNPNEYLSYQIGAGQGFHGMPDRPPMTIKPLSNQPTNRSPEPFNQGQATHHFSTKPGEHQPACLVTRNPHHLDRQVDGGESQLTNRAPNSPYEINDRNLDQFKGGNNSFMLNRTAVRSDTINPLTKIDFVGYSATGEKITDKSYYQKSPGRQNETDFYREYKKMNSHGDYLPSNQQQLHQQYQDYSPTPKPRQIPLTQGNLRAKNQPR